MKRFESGVVIGKFYPPHRGHSLLIETAASQCRRLTVLVCGKPEQTMPLAVRVACLREIHPDVEVIPVEDTIDDDDTLGWAAFTVSILGGVPDAVFTSEDYGEPYARAMGSTHVMVDRRRVAVPCSGTMIRERPLEHLEWLAPCVRAYYIKRVCTIGAESTGTTTLAEALAEHYQTAWVPEYGREYCERKWPDGDYTDEWATAEFAHIAAEQSRREERAARTANKVLFCDTDAFATTIWHERYLGGRSPEVEEIAARRPADLYLLTGDEIPFEQDGWRDGEHIRHWMHRRFEEDLAATGRRWELLRGPHNERLARAIALVDALLKE